MSTPEQRRRLRDALISAFPARESLEQMLLYQLGRNLNQITGNSNLEDIIFQLIQTAEAEGWIDHLVEGAYRSNSGNRELRILWEEWPRPVPPDRNPMPSVSPYSRELKSDHKYQGQLVRMEIHFPDSNHKGTQLVGVVLNISFGEVEEPYEPCIDENESAVVEPERYLRFGIKFGTLCFELTNGYMPLNLCRLINNQEFNGLVTSMGTRRNPTWQFKVNSQSQDGNRAVLSGSLHNQDLGSIELQSISCQVDAIFQVSINSNSLEITADSGLWNEGTSNRIRATQLAYFFRNVLKPKLEDYVSRVVVEYVPVNNS
ncbi:effector-associated domain EAD1-containing protein [Aetokthonos hydrillicola Thurmond2011]|jgi:hypothetical protein|uniref:Effector-associated domain EAD1-containing protein n=1 Tax=Aetokthonos hydrillicola Thurmond2011 TaxID=2712845 RepID=A0AAP5ICW6_9CYAN|nr:effector-associated domain EAD1-containing protein [Aetokthonos hydrillicola]MBO3461720.1 hypothetical protein [Aetokthonos hydrillicola CCALA 1050]MBW4583900.1 hypothetical protein [Aetokthonos hydrillicola CCALA 1050]MDR9898904.1 effector-associated domain EAD1-containing protein [Aetokthonos hydrillicola Thurmond2011]